MSSYAALAADHAQALAEAIQREQRALRELDSKKADVRTSAAGLRRQLESDFSSEVRRRRDAACAAVNDALVPILASFHKEPTRALAGQLIEAYAEQRTRILEVTGFDIEQSRRIALVMAEVMRQAQPDAPNRFAGPWQNNTDRAEATIRAGIHTNDAPAVYAGLLELETALRAVGVGSAPYADAELLWAAKFNDLEGNQPTTVHRGPNAGSAIV